MLKSSLKLICFIVCFALAGWFCRKQTDRFTIAKITPKFSTHQEWLTPHIDPEEKVRIKQILQQPFYYLGKGNQCFVFASQDQMYVLKFPRHRQLPFWKTLFMQEPSMHEDFASYTLAFEELKEETGLVYLHLNPTQDFQTTVTIVDKIGIAHVLPLDTMTFLLQKKAQLLYTSLEERIAKGEIEHAKTTLTNLGYLLKSRYEKGLIDADSDLNTNFGCIETTPIQIDIGRLTRGQKTAAQQSEELLKTTDNLSQWLRAREPLLDQHLQTTLCDK
jgi:hypothetical protein